jgi:hypothetical protein
MVEDEDKDATVEVYSKVVVGVRVDPTVTIIGRMTILSQNV